MAMLESTLPPARKERGLAGFGQRIGCLVDAIERAIDVRRERRMLLGLDDSALKDLGWARGDAYAEAVRACWDVSAAVACEKRADAPR
jgi:uncharacterized protein YjiS (DUF1127 family)